MIGSGGLVVMDDKSCDGYEDFARLFHDFTQNRVCEVRSCVRYEENA